jgi:hypothetical protein
VRAASRAPWATRVSRSNHQGGIPLGNPIAEDDFVAVAGTGVIMKLSLEEWPAP